MNETTYDLSPARKVFSRIGLALCTLLLITTALQLLWVIIPELIWGEENWATSSSWGKWIGSFAPLYLVAVPICVLIMRKVPAHAPQGHKLSASHFVAIFPICICLMYSGSLIGSILSMLFSAGTSENPIEVYVMDSNPLKTLVVVVLAPMIEEFVCRKQIIDRTSQYGEKTAVFLSALAFGLLHQNLYQFFYAFSLGWLFGYIYLRTGRLRYTILLHSIINFMGGVIAPWIMSLLNSDAIMNMDPNATNEELIQLLGDLMPVLLICLLYSMILIGLAIAGLVLLITERKQLRWKEAETQLPKGTAVKTVYLNVGMVLYVLLCAAGIVLSLL